MKQALEALELAQDNLRSHGDNCFLHDEGEYNRCFCGKDSLSNFLQEQVESLSQAIEQAEKNEFKPDWDAMAVMVEEQQRMAKRIEELEQAEKQEPDAYGYAKRLAVAIWEQHYKDVAPQWKPFDDLMGVLTQIDNMTTGLTAQRQPQYNKTEMNCFVQNLYDQKMREGKRGHYETMFHVVHRAIEAAHGIGEKK